MYKFKDLRSRIQGLRENKKGMTFQPFLKFDKIEWFLMLQYKNFLALLESINTKGNKIDSQNSTT